MKQENEKKLYEPPALTAVTFKAEKGYASSSTNGGVVNYLWGVSQLWGADETHNTASDYSWGSDQNWN